MKAAASPIAEFDPADPGSVITAMYAMISGPAGARDWKRHDDLFLPDARQARTGIDADGRPWMKIMTPAEYRQNTEPFFAQNGFYEVEISRRLELFGNVAHAWSAYEARHSPSDETPERRGVNSIQLFRDAEGRWRIYSMIWDNERDGVKIAPR